MNGQANAYVRDSDVTTTGAVNVVTLNQSDIDSTSLSASTSTQNAWGVTLAFNSIGWDSHDIASRALEELLDENKVSAVRGVGGQAAENKAYLQDSIQRSTRAVP